MGIEQGFRPEREMGFKIENIEAFEGGKKEITKEEAKRVFESTTVLAEAKTGKKREMPENN